MYLPKILLHARLQVTLKGVHVDSEIHHVFWQIHASRFRSLHNLPHSRLDQAIKTSISQSDSTCIETGDGADGIETSIIHQLLPTVVANVSRVYAICFPTPGINVNKLACFGDPGVDADVRVLKGTDEYSIGFVVNNVACRSLLAAN